MGSYKIEIRKHQIVNDQGVDIIVQCDQINLTSNYVPGTISPNDWIDITNDVSGLQKISLKWELSETKSDGINNEKGISIGIIITGPSFNIVFDWLYGSVCSHLNSFDVRITDLEAGQPFRLFEIKADNNTYRPDDGCKLELTIREQDSRWHCLSKTNIYDNWQNWFSESGIKEHPCFLTCIDKRPANMMRLGLKMFILSCPTIVTQIVHGITDERDETARKELGLIYFSPSPKIYDLILNAAMKCGYQLDTIFDPGNEEHNDCLFYPVSGKYHEDITDAVESPSLQFIADNIDYIALSDFLDDLAIEKNAEWRAEGDVIRFKYKYDLLNEAPIYDFTILNDAYAIELLFNGQKKPKLYTFKHQIDDGASNEVNVLYSDSINFDRGNNNLMLEGNKRIESRFASTGFVRDGMHKDYIVDTIRDGRTQAFMFMAVAFIATAQSIIGAIVGVGVTLTQTIVLEALVTQWKNRFGSFFGEGAKYTGAVRLKLTDTVNIPRIIRWDGENMRRAKAAYVDNPIPNPEYNDQPKSYKDKYTRLSQTNNGFDDSYNMPPSGSANYRAFNYANYFDQDFVGNLADKHDATINPNKNLETNQTIKWKSCATVGLKNTFGVYEGQICKVGKIVKIYSFGNYGGFAKILSFELVDSEIIYTGKLLRR